MTPGELQEIRARRSGDDVEQLVREIERAHRALRVTRAALRSLMDAGIPGVRAGDASRALRETGGIVDE